MNPKRILITGGAGCLGANIIAHLRARGDTSPICVIDNFATSARETLPVNGPDFQVIEGHIADQAMVNRAFADFAPTHVIHSAASYKDPDDYAEDGRSNVMGTAFVLEAAKNSGVVRFVNFQTALCYGRPDHTPIPVDAPLRPFTSYGVSKTAGEQMVMRSGLNTVSLRLGNITGPRLSIGPIPTFYTRLKAQKACFCSDTVRDFLDMADFLRLFDMALESDAPKGVFNVSTGQGHSIKNVFDTVAEILGLTPEAPPIVPPSADDVPVVVLDPSATEAAFGWKAEIDFKTSLQKMLNWYDEYGVRAVYAHLKAPTDKS